MANEGSTNTAYTRSDISHLFDLEAFLWSFLCAGSRNLIHVHISHCDETSRENSQIKLNAGPGVGIVNVTRAPTKRASNGIPDHMTYGSPSKRSSQLLENT